MFEKKIQKNYQLLYDTKAILTSGGNEKAIISMMAFFISASPDIKYETSKIQKSQKQKAGRVKEVYSKNTLFIQEDFSFSNRFGAPCLRFSSPYFQAPPGFPKLGFASNDGYREQVGCICGP